MGVRIASVFARKYVLTYVRNTYAPQNNTYTNVFVRIPYVFRTYSYVFCPYSYVSRTYSVRIRPYSYVFWQVSKIVIRTYCVRIASVFALKYVREYVRNTYTPQNNTYTNVFVRIPYVFRTYSYVFRPYSYVSRTYSVRIRTYSYVFWQLSKIIIRTYCVRIAFKIHTYSAQNTYVKRQNTDNCQKRIHCTKSGLCGHPAASSGTVRGIRSAHIEQVP